MHQDAFDTVEKSAPISALQIAALVRDFAIAEVKLHLTTSAGMVAERLVDLGVETCGDLRFVTFSEYVAECGVRPTDARRLVAHFAPPEKVERAANAPRGVAQAVRSRMRFVAANRVIDPAQGLENVVDNDDGQDWVKTTTSVNEAPLSVLWKASCNKVRSQQAQMVQSRKCQGRW